MRKTGMILGMALMIFHFSYSQDQRKHTDDELLSIARLVMDKAGNCALITLDYDGHPRARTMDPFAPDEYMIVWFGTNPHSRKVKEITADSRVTLYYFDKPGGSYVIITGNAELVNDPQVKESKWKTEWEGFYTDREMNYMLIKVTPLTLEVVSPQNEVVTDGLTWQPPIVKF